MPEMGLCGGVCDSFGGVCLPGCEVAEVEKCPLRKSLR